MRQPFDTIVVGAGIVGATTALFLAKRGLKVAIVDKKGIGQAASGRNGGLIRQQERPAEEQQLVMEAAKLWAAHQTWLEADIEFQQGGSVRLQKNEQEKKRAHERIPRELAAGLPVEMLTPDETKERFPVLNPSLKITGGTFCPTDSTANPLLVMQALGRAIRKLDVTIKTAEPVKSLIVKKGRIRAIETDQGEYGADHVAICAGPWSRQLVNTIGLDIPTHGEKYQITVTESYKPVIETFISFDKGYIRQAFDGNFHMGARGAVKSLDMDYTKTTLLSVCQVLPAVVPLLRRIKIIRGFAGIGSYSPDTLPVIDAAPDVGGLYLGTCFSSHGFCVGPLAGKLLSELIIDNECSVDLKPFRWARFN